MQIDLTKLKGSKLFIATPMYGGMCNGLFTKSILELNSVCTELGIQFQYYFLFNESLITRARNYAADAFLQSQADHMLFIDSDIGFSAVDVMAMLYISKFEEGMDIVCGPYPKKNISWEKIKKAVDMGIADSNPNELEEYVGDFVLHFAKQGSFSLGRPIEVTEAGTGFMMIKRDVFVDFATAYPEMKYTPDHKRDKDFNGDRDITAFFMDLIDKEENRHLSEDYMFCKWSRKIGKKIWICPWISLSHTGSYTFKGNLVKVVSSGLSATMETTNSAEKK